MPSCHHFLFARSDCLRVATADSIIAKTLSIIEIVVKIHLPPRQVRKELLSPSDNSKRRCRCHPAEILDRPNNINFIRMHCKMSSCSKSNANVSKVRPAPKMIVRCCIREE